MRGGLARLLVAGALCAVAAPPPAVGVGLPERFEALVAFGSEARKERRAAARAVEAPRDRDLVPAMVDLLFFVPRERRGELLGALERLTGERHQSYYDWVEWVGAHPEIESPDGYLVWKLFLLQRIDANYGRVLYPGAPHTLRLEEVISGGVPLAGIPTLDDPPTVPAAEARYLDDGERVFGVELGGEARAYPLRFLSWHELLNDTVGGTPICLSFCTLCGSGIVYSARTGPAGEPYRFDTSGLLYRSNKLMVDRRTYTLWSNLTGRPVVGRLATTDLELEMLPSTLTTWGEWRDRHPGTRVLDLKALRALGARYGFDYRPLAADRARTGVSFPVWQRSDRLERDEEVFAVRLAGVARAYPLERLVAAGVVNDRMGEVPLVLVADPASRSVRAYRRGDRRFVRGASSVELVDGDGALWRVEEAVLVPAGGPRGGSPREALERVPGHVAFWFGWYGFYPQTEVWTGDVVGDLPSSP